MEKKRKAYISENCTWQLVNKAKALWKNNTHLDRGRYYDICKTKNLYVSSQKEWQFKLSTFSFKPLMLKLTKRLKL